MTLFVHFVLIFFLFPPTLDAEGWLLTDLKAGFKLNCQSDEAITAIGFKNYSKDIRFLIVCRKIINRIDKKLFAKTRITKYLNTNEDNIRDFTKICQEGEIIGGLKGVYLNRERYIRFECRSMPHEKINEVLCHRKSVRLGKEYNSLNGDMVKNFDKGFPRLCLTTVVFTNAGIIGRFCFYEFQDVEYSWAYLLLKAQGEVKCKYFCCEEQCKAECKKENPTKSAKCGSGCVDSKTKYFVTGSCIDYFSCAEKCSKYKPGIRYGLLSALECRPTVCQADIKDDDVDTSKSSTISPSKSTSETPDESQSTTDRTTEENRSTSTEKSSYESTTSDSVETTTDQYPEEMVTSTQQESETKSTSISELTKHSTEVTKPASSPEKCLNSREKWFGSRFCNEDGQCVARCKQWISDVEKVEIEVEKSLCEPMETGQDVQCHCIYESAWEEGCETSYYDWNSGQKEKRDISVESQSKEKECYYNPNVICGVLGSDESDSKEIQKDSYEDASREEYWGKENIEELKDNTEMNEAYGVICPSDECSNCNCNCPE